MPRPLTTSVIICTRNRIADLIVMLESLTKQTKIPDELIIVDSSDEQIIHNRAIAHVFAEKQFPHTKLIYKHTKPGLTYQRNVGVRTATSQVAYFFDDDVVLEPDYLEQMTTLFARYPAYAGGMGTITNIPGKPKGFGQFLRHLFLLQRDYATGMFTYSGMPTHPYGTEQVKDVQVLGGCCMAFRTIALKKHPFDETLTGYGYLEDADVAYRISKDAPLFFNPHAKLQHYNSPSSRDALMYNRAMFIHNYSYLFFKNFYPRNKIKIIAYCWAIIGLFVEALYARSLVYIRGYFLGLWRFYWSSTPMFNKEYELYDSEQEQI